MAALGASASPPRGRARSLYCTTADAPSRRWGRQPMPEADDERAIPLSTEKLRAPVRNQGDLTTGLSTGLVLSNLVAMARQSDEKSYTSARESGDFRSKETLLYRGGVVSRF